MPKKMSLISFFIPRQIKLRDSKYNRNVSLLQYLNFTSLLVDGLIESGSIMTHIWKRGINKLLPSNFTPQKVLLLGLAGGCNARLINRYYPEAKITAVEIDPYMVELGQKYFGLRKIRNLTIKIADAKEFAQKLKPSDRFDLVLVDCFVGQEIPRKLEDPKFFHDLKTHSRFVLVNRLWWQHNKPATSRFFRGLSKDFFFIKTHTHSNVIISLV